MKSSKPRLFNRVSRELLKERIAQSNEKRITISFYRYHNLQNPQQFRDELFLKLDEIGVLGRIYVAHEGINGQISVPETQFEAFKERLYNIEWLNGCRLNIAVDDDGKSFYMLKIKLRHKIVSDGLNDETFDVTNKGQHVNAAEFNELLENPNSIVVDFRNHYESEVGHFEGAVCPEVDTFRESLPLIENMLHEIGGEEKNLVMYCTGGIRCEKASAYFKHKGFKNVFQLDGGIIQYAKQVATEGLANKFKGVNFVFDERLGERISEDVVAKCHQCGAPCDTHINCANELCHLLFIQCDACREKFDACCSHKCKDFKQLPEEKRIALKGTIVFNGSKRGENRHKSHRGKVLLDAN